jgi:serine/threonine protein kinase
VIDDSSTHPISRWSAAEAAEHRDDIKNAMEWVSYGIRRSMARSMFPQFPEGCQGKPFREVYQLNKKLKSGTFSTVCRGVHRATGRQVAVKCILRKKIEPSVDAAVFEEVLIMSGLHHKFICPMIDYFEEDRCHFVVMELEKGGDLCERLNDKVTYSEDDARTVVRNICEAMEFVHSKGFAHCDIKPRNYLLRSKRDDVDVRLADFGFAQHVHAPNSLTSQCGTPFFVAPEVINRKPYDQKVDMWSIGVTTYLLLCGDTPFNGKNRQQLFRKISCDEPTFPDDKWGHVSDEAVEFVRKLLTKDPAKRLSAAQALQHRWVTQGNDLLVEQQQQQQQVHAMHSGGESSENFVEKKRRGSSRSRSRVKPVSNHHVEMSPVSPTPSSSSRARSKPRSSNRSISRDRTKNRSMSRESTSRHSVSQNSVSRSNRNRSASRDRTHLSRATPPPPPKPQAHERRAMHNSGSSAADENARLLDVIKNQDAKIEKLERMVKRMLEPEGDVHEC